MSAVYCEACGASLGEEAKFCRACGVAQSTPSIPAPPPPLPPVSTGLAPPAPPARRVASTPARIGAILAIVGGLGMCLITLHAIVYLPLHYHDPLNFGESLQFGDLLAIGSGLAAIAVGIGVLTGRPGSAAARGVVLALAGAPTLILALLWAFPEASHFTVFPLPFYFGFVYFANLGIVHVSNGAVPVPLVAACLIVIAAAIAVALPTAQASPAAYGR